MKRHLLNLKDSEMSFLLSLKTKSIKTLTKADRYRRQLNNLNAAGQLCLFSPSNYDKGHNFVRYGNDVNKLIKYVDNKRNWYLSFNSFNGWHRAESNTLGLNGFFIDCDCKKAGINKGRFLWYLPKLLELANLPQPTAVKDSGHGFHLIYWFKHQVIIHNQSINRLWNKIERKLVSNVNKATEAMYKQNIGDMKATDSSRVLRVVNSWNVKEHPVKCFLDYYHPSFRHDMFNYWVDYLPKIKYKTPSSGKNAGKSKHHNPMDVRLTFKKNSSLTLNLYRALDLKHWIKLRKYSIKGCREEFLFLYACCAIHCETPQHVMNDIKHLNSKLTDRLDPSQITNLKTEMEHINFKCYRFPSIRIIKLLGITPNEERKLKTIISRDESYRRRKIKRHQKSHNRKYKRSLEIIKLHQNGLSYRKIAKKLKTSLGTVESTIKANN